MNGNEEFVDNEHIDEEVEIIDESALPEDNEYRNIQMIEDDEVEREEDEEEDEEQQERNEDMCEFDSSNHATFDQHSEPVFCCDLSNDDKYAITGGQDDRAFVWSTADQKVKFECTDHEDSVVQVGFNVDSKLVASADFAGHLRVWSVSSGRCVYKQELDEISFMRWHPVVPDVLLVGCQSSLCLLKINNDNKMKWIAGPCAPICGEFLPDNKRVAVTYEDGTVRVWDLSTEEATVTVVDRRDQHELSSLAVRSDGLLACGSISGKVKLINSNTGKFTWKFFVDNITDRTEFDEDNLHSVEALCFTENPPLLISGSVNGLIEFWDINAQIKRQQIETPEGISTLKMSKTNPTHLFVAGLDGAVRVFDIRDGKLIKEIVAHSDRVLDICLSSTSDMFISTSEDGTAKVFRVNE